MLGAGEAEGAGDCASAAPPNATMESAARAARKVLIRFISGILHPTHGGRGIVPLLTDGKPLGFLNPTLYRLGVNKGAKAGIVDVTIGNNTQSGVPGFAATSGFDIASGWGTVDPATFVPVLAKAAG